MYRIYSLEELSKLDAGTKIVCYDIPFNMRCSFFTYKDWKVQIIRNAIAFKKKNDKWPNFMTANPLTFENCWLEVERSIEEIDNNINMKWKRIDPFDKEKQIEPFDWETFDINESIDKYPIQIMPVTITDRLFSTPLFSMLWLDSKAYDENIYKLSFGTHPGPDDGEDFEEIDIGEPLLLRRVA
ncbi:MAG: hypothetical protein IKO95_02465 [Spirochaetia bacterium]|nr:hypothetical protein [Spirochaetia bacterium]